MNKSFYFKYTTAILLSSLLLSAFGEVSTRDLPAGSKIIEERNGHIVGFMPIRDLDKMTIISPPVDDTRLTEDEDCLLIMQACREMGLTPGREKPGDAIFYQPYIFLKEKEELREKFYCVIDITSYCLYELKNGQKVIDRTANYLQQAILSFEFQDGKWMMLEFKEAIDSFLPGIPVEEREGYYSGITEEMWGEMSDAGFDLSFPLEQIIRYLDANQFNNTFIIR